MAERVPHTWTAQALLLTALAFCYMPALTATFGYADDFVQLNESQGSIKFHGCSGLIARHCGCPSLSG